MDSLPHSAPRTPPIRPLRKIPCALALAATALLAPVGALAAQPQGGGPGAAGDGATGGQASPPLIQNAGIQQAGRKLILTVRTGPSLAPQDLQARPVLARASSRYLCFELSRPGGRGARRLCFGPNPHRLGSESVNAAGKVVAKGSLAATVKRPTGHRLVAALVPDEAGLLPRRYRWRVVGSRGCEPGERCAESLPASGAFAFRLRPVRPVGCTGGSAGLVSNGPRDRKVVALTFDDGPSEYTPGFLQVLREKGVVGTFFEIGQNMPGREDVMREILAQGSELGDHTMTHDEYPGYAEIAGAAARIREYTHFQPCLFRPPGGGVDSSVIATAGGLGMRTINWDVDPRDWSTPGSGAIYSTIVANAHPGSIILMHDGGGPRGETLAALPQVIDTLRARGYGFTTVSQLLGYHLIYRPYG